MVENGVAVARRQVACLIYGKLNPDELSDCFFSDFINVVKYLTRS